MVTEVTAKIRLFVEHPLGAGQSVPLNRDQAHYLFNVMRLAIGARVKLFNGVDGEWLCSVVEKGKRGGVLHAEEQLRDVQMPPDLWLIFAPIKKARTDFIVEKATEMGAARIMPVQTTYTNADRIRHDKLQAHAVEAAEQCGGTYVPEVTALQKLDRLLADWPTGEKQERQLLFCDEALIGQSSGFADGLSDAERTAPWAILIGPEGGFSPEERARLRDLPYAHPVSLGPRILRADTAAVAAMTIWQQMLGDWA
ncbi:MAG: 16S rRNA (uracil(1498)-N(3))-methyltransferase [Rhodobacterales bacterium]|nr:16S rRNA (uracil(1498)-N(3))-methyltransferase [Rhodobacterales bacterium]